MSEEFTFRNWLSEGIHGVRDKMRFPGGGLLPEQFRQHMKASRKEFLMAFRSLFDAAIEHVDRPKTSRRKATKIKVE